MYTRGCGGGLQAAMAAGNAFDSCYDRIDHAAHDKSPGVLVSLPLRETLAARLAFDSTPALESHDASAGASNPLLVPTIPAAWLAVFRPCFTAPAGNRVLVLVAGAVLAPGKRTVCSVLRVMGLADNQNFRRTHDVLSRARWDDGAVARRVLLYITARLLPEGKVVIGIDDTIESRWGAKIKAHDMSAIRFDPRRDTSSKPVVCAGSI
jgi:hypothetical protein